MRSFIVYTLFICLQLTQSFAQRQKTIAISGATLIDGTGGAPVRNAVVLIEGDVISQVGTTETVPVPPSAQLIDARGKFVIPGLIDTHLHLELVGLSDVGELPPRWSEPGLMRQLVMTNAKLDLIAGFTTVRDLGSTAMVLQVRDEINAGNVVGSRIFTAGMQLVKRASAQESDPTFLEYDSPDSARAKVRYLAALGVDVIKIRLTHSRPIPSLDEVRAIVQEAHRYGFRATVHTDVPADDLVRLAIDAGADGIEHNAPLRSKDESILTDMAQRGMSLMTGGGAFWLQRLDTTALIDSLDLSQLTLFPDDVLSALHLGIDSVHRQTEQMKSSGWDAHQRRESFSRELERARNAGVLLVFGTDCGGYGMVHGDQYKALFGENQLGASPMQALLMATRDAATALGKVNALGTIEVGKLADLIILNADPLVDVRNIHQIFRVIKAGTVYDPAELRSGKR